MYNRYIPQADGTYRRSRVPDNSLKLSHANVEHPSRPTVEQPPHCQEEQPSVPPRCDELPKQQPPCSRCGRKPHHPRPEQRNDPASVSIGKFLKQLLPKNFDTGDLLVVLLLLLMSADCPDDQNTALLTLVLYLFM